MQCDWLQIVKNLNVWKQGDRVAPHKPLLLLLILARARSGGPNSFAFMDDIDERLHNLLVEFGPTVRQPQAELPFWHLQSDGIWIVEGTETLKRRKGKDIPLRSELKKGNPVGHVPDELWQRLSRDSDLIPTLAESILDQFWPASQHDSLLQAVGLQVDAGGKRSGRDPKFRESALRAYERRCAFCGYDARICDRLFGLDAAHIRWHAYDGPDDAGNGLPLCSLHHAAFDKGAMSLDDRLRVLVSEELTGGAPQVREGIIALSGKRIQNPVRDSYLPQTRFIHWPRKNVFKGSAR